MDTKKLTEGAMMLSLICVLMLVNRMFAGMFDVMICFFICFPVIVYTVKYGWKDSFILLMSGVLVSCFISNLITLFYLCSYMICGYVYGIGTHNKWKNGYLLIITFILSFISTIISTVVLASLFGYDMQEDVVLIKEFVASISFYQVEFSSSTIHIILILGTVFTSILETICIHVLAIYLLHRLSLPYRKMKTIREFTFPNWVFYINILIWLLYFTRNVIELKKEVIDIMTVLYVISFILMLVYGMVYIVHIATEKRNKALIILAWIGLFIPIIRMIFAWIGLLDGIFNLRKLDMRKKS